MKAYKEALLWANVYPADVQEYHDRHHEQVTALRQFYRGEIDPNTLREALSNYTLLPGGVVLEHPGPLYGLLRQYFGYSKVDAHRLSGEEKAHYLEAQARGMNPRIHIEVTAHMTDTGLPADDSRMPFITVLSSVVDVPDDEIIEAVEAITRAPENPSYFDEDLLPE